MIDVRLTATNPEDSTLVPVPCNQRGELLTVAPKIEKIPNDVEIEGDLTVTGLINGSDGVGAQGPPGKDGEPGGEGPQGPQGDPGEGVPLPYGPDGAYLRIVDGVPAWGDNTPPEPPPTPEPLIWTNISQTGGLKDLAGNPISPSDPYEWLSTQPSWLNNDDYTTLGSNVKNNVAVGGSDSPAFEFNDVFGMVLIIYMNCNYYKHKKGSLPWTTQMEFDNTDINLIAVSGPNLTPSGAEGNYTAAWEISYLIQRDISSANLGWLFESTGANYYEFHFRGWILQDQGAYALHRQMSVEKEIKRLRGVIMDIDKESQT
jgi:hypothetical protein